MVGGLGGDIKMKKWDQKEITKLASAYVEIAKIVEPDDMIHDAFCAGFIAACNYEAWVGNITETNEAKKPTL